MLKKFALLVLSIVGFTAFIGCNSDNEIYNTAVSYSSTQVKSFKLENNKKVLASLDTVFFSIDLVNARIFNADSLPYGTKVNKLIVRIGTDNCSVIELTMPSSNGGDTIVNYMTNSTDSIDFSRGPVVLRVVSYDGKEERKYMIDVNVHKVVPDSLYWNELAMRQLPTSLSEVCDQKTVKTVDNRVVCLSSDGVSYCVADAWRADAHEWRYRTPELSFTPDITTLTATEEALFVLSTSGELYTSTDLGMTWTSTGENWSNIIGTYEMQLLGVRNDGSGLVHVTYPTGAEIAADKEFPATGASNMVTLTSRWSVKPQTIIAGGKKADGTLSKAVWGYDGRNWLKLSESLPAAISDASLVSYTLAKTDTVTWTVKSMPALLMIGGRTEEGLSAATYVSRDMGLTWKTGDQLITLPDYIAPRYGAQALVEDTTYPLLDEVSGVSAWLDRESRELPGWWEICGKTESRAVAPATSWECPFIYWFGGYSAEGKLYDTVWKGVINRLMFRPLE